MPFVSKTYLYGQIHWETISCPYHLGYVSRLPKMLSWAVSHPLNDCLYMHKAKIGNNPIGYISCVLFQYGFIVGKATRRQRAKISIRDIHT